MSPCCARNICAATAAAAISMAGTTYTTSYFACERPPRIRLRHGELQFFLKLSINDCNRPRGELAGTPSNGGLRTVLTRRAIAVPYNLRLNPKAKETGVATCRLQNACDAASRKEHDCSSGERDPYRRGRGPGSVRGRAGGIGREVQCEEFHRRHRGAARQRSPDCGA